MEEAFNLTDIDGGDGGADAALHASMPVRRPSPSLGTGSKSRAVSLASMLVRAGVTTEAQIARAQDIARRDHLPLSRALVQEGLVLSMELAIMTAAYMGVAMVDLRGEDIEPEAVSLLPEQLATRYVALPIRMSGDYLTVAMTDPTDLRVLQDLSIRTGYRIEPVVATMESIIEHIDLTYRSARVTTHDAEGDGGIAPVRSRVTAGTLREAAPSEVVDLLVRQAIQDRASDLHVEPTDQHLRVRFRIDGMLHDVMALPLEMHPTIVSRLKIMSGMNIAERRRPQDGQFSVDLGDRSVDVRVAVSSTVDGEMAVMRLLEKAFSLKSLDQLGMGHDLAERFRGLLRLPFGIVAVCGPTGAGKSTTLYASILQMNRVEQNVISLEDPVEYQISDANQMQIRAEAGVTFATQLRSILRLDPDVIFVGEIRDEETALIATQAALTGHLVLTSLHANDAVSALLRLKDLGVPPYLIASSVQGIVAQRMVREVCHECRVLQHRPVTEQQAYEEVTGEHVEQFIYGAGCNTCAHTGYRGRTGVFEVLAMTDPMRNLFMNEAPHEQLAAQATADGMVPLRYDGMQKVKEGGTTPYEMMRVLYNIG